MRACKSGVTKMSVADGKVATNGMCKAKRSTTCFALSRRSSKVTLPFSSRMFDMENFAVPLDGSGDGLENLSIRSKKLKRSPSNRTIFTRGESIFGSLTTGASRNSDDHEVRTIRRKTSAKSFDASGALARLAADSPMCTPSASKSSVVGIERNAPHGHGAIEQRRQLAFGDMANDRRRDEETEQADREDRHDQSDDDAPRAALVNDAVQHLPDVGK